VLKLTRRAGERICVGSDIVVEVVEIDRERNQALIGISAPSHDVYREEIVRERQETGDTSGADRDAVLARSKLALRIARAINKEETAQPGIAADVVELAKLIEEMLPQFT
jgi:carbon storage regulator CsrA